MHVINRYFKEEGSFVNNERIYFSFYACSATENQVIILDLILSSISTHRGLLVHHLFQNFTILLTLFSSTFNSV